MMRDKPIDSTDEGVVYQRPDGSCYVRPYQSEPRRNSKGAQDELPPLPPKQPQARGAPRPAWMRGDKHRTRPNIKLRLLRHLATGRAEPVDRLAELLQRKSSGVYRHCYELMRHGLITRRAEKQRTASGQAVRCYAITEAGRKLLRDWGVRDDV